MGIFRQKDDATQLELVHADLARVLRETVRRLPFDCFVVRGLASAAEQQALYAIGRTVERWRKPVTPLDGVKKRSRHQDGLAVDLAPWQVIEHGQWIDTPATNDLFRDIGELAEQVADEFHVEQYRWGGRFTRPDLPHHELCLPGGQQVGHA